MLSQIQCTILTGLEMDQLNRTLTLKTLYRDEIFCVQYRIVFVDVMATGMNTIPDSETLISIHEVPADLIWETEERLFRAHNGCLWPNCFKNKLDFLRKIRSKYLRAFQIISDSGSSGWVIAQDPVVTSTRIPLQSTGGEE